MAGKLLINQPSAATPRRLQLEREPGDIPSQNRDGNTRGSVLLVMLFHSFMNTWIEVFPAPAADQAIAQWSFNGLLVILALVLVAVFGAAIAQVRVRNPGPGRRRVDGAVGQDCDVAHAATCCR
jgi:hypothetical protein